MKGWHTKLLALLAALFLGGCINLNDPSAKLQEQLASLNLIIKESASAAGVLSADLPQAVWVTLYAVEGVDESGQTVSFYDAGAQGEAINLLSLSDVAALLDSRSVPAGRYTRLRLRLGTTVKVIAADGTAKEYTVPNSTPPDFVLDIPFQNPVDLAAGDVGSLILNVDVEAVLAQLGPDTTSIDLSGIVETQTDPTTLPGVQARVHGRVGQVDVGANSFTLIRDDAVALTVTLHELAVIIDENSGTPLSLSDLNPNDEVEAFGGFDPVRLTLTAVAVSVNPQPVARGGSNAVINHPVEVEGWLSNLGNGSAQLRMHEASFIPDVATINVIDLINAVYEHGTYQQLADGVKVEIKGTWDGNTLTAQFVDVEGARPAPQAQDSTDERPVEVKGQVQTWDPTNQNLTLVITEVEGSSALSVGDTLNLSLDGAWFKRGAPNCLATGTEVELKGVMGQGTGLIATVVKVKGPCAAFPLNGRNDHDRDGSGMDGSGMDGSGMDGSGMDNSGMDGSGMNDSGMNDSGMNDSGMNDSGMNDSGMNDSGMDGSGMDDHGS